MFKIWVDADSCPSRIRDIILKNAKRLSLEVSFVANRNIPFSLSDSLFSMIVCPNEEGAADNYIVSNAEKKDLVITRDLPLAKRLIEKEIDVINDRGKIFYQENLEKMLTQRNLNMLMSAAGIKSNGRKDSYGKKEIYEFSNCLDKILSKKIKENR